MAGGVVQAISVPRHRCTGVALQLQLPPTGVSRLRHMAINHCTLAFSSSSSTEQVGAAVALPMLRFLSLSRCTMPLDTLPLLQCPKVTHLHLSSPPSHPHTAGSAVQLDSALSALLQRLPSLLTLSLGLSQASEAALTQLSSLQQLQSCSLKGPCVTPRVLAQLTSSLTYLSLQKRDAVLCEQDLPAAGWPHLKQLKLAHIRIQPTLLSRFTTLERLQLFCGRLLAYSANVSGLLLAWGGCVVLCCTRCVIPCCTVLLLHCMGVPAVSISMFASSCAGVARLQFINSCDSHNICQLAVPSTIWWHCNNTYGCDSAHHS